MLINDYIEINIDSLIGPSHCFLGLSNGNKASMSHQYHTSSPLKACLEGLKKMKLVLDLGIPQYILPPHPRPVLLKDEVIDDLLLFEDEIFYNRLSASSMWMANSAHVSSSLNCRDGNMHVTPANLLSTSHRKYETFFHSKLLELIFPFAIHHDPIEIYQDEGAANTCYLSTGCNQPSLHLFFYGKDNSSVIDSKTYPRRQDKESYLKLIDQHQLPNSHVLLLKQKPYAIDSGVFHNDVISTSTNQVFLYHEHTASGDDINYIQDIYNTLYQKPLESVRIENTQLPIHIALSSYLFNSQILELSSDNMILLAPEDCLKYNESRETIRFIIEHENPIKSVKFVSLNQSMMNGGGPACLRLRAQLNSEERNLIPSSFRFTDELYYQLSHFVTKYYPKKLTPSDLKSRSFLIDLADIYHRLYQLFDLSLYDLSNS